MYQLEKSAQCICYFAIFSQSMLVHTAIYFGQL